MLEVAYQLALPANLESVQRLLRHSSDATFRIRVIIWIIQSSSLDLTFQCQRNQLQA
ncbi:uncharacterized protein M6B38_305750 [Iris pallida]|uniref:Uncharacterized protein n=1 Tax=Iris pallida TaxID=29817 RepID=A0AAX6HMY7_IRIPA|nr:uncharacterized protein M6B38_305750 [Iris pallida]